MYLFHSIMLEDGLQLVINPNMKQYIMMWIGTCTNRRQGNYPLGCVRGFLTSSFKKAMNVPLSVKKEEE